MFTERLTEFDINKFRTITQLTVEGKVIPFRICCNDVFYNDLRGNTKYVMFLKDFTCILPFAEKDIKDNLNRHYRQFMIEKFGNEYRNALSIYLFKNSSNETIAKDNKTL